VNPSTWSGPFLVACGLLVVSGAGKVRDPEAASRALSAVGLPASGWMVRSGGALEAGLGLAAGCLAGAPLTLAVAAVYLAFAGFIVLTLRRGGSQASCGCFGRADARPSVTHVVLDAAGVAAAFAAAASGPSVRLTAVLAQQPLAGVPFVVAAATAAYLVHLAFVFPPGRRVWTST